MKQMLRDGDNPFLPEEIIRNILKRLPVKSLIRFQYVCKHWKNLFKTPSFIEEHLLHSSLQNPCILFEGDRLELELELDLLDCDMQVRKVQSPPLDGSLSGACIIGSSNGLLCYEIHEQGIYPSSLLLWNPAIREVRYVPRTINDFEEGSWYLGFGFSPIINDYKIVRINQIDSGDGNQVNRVEVYSLSTGSWKEVDFGNLKGVSFDSKTIAFNGTMFWFGYKHDDDEDYIYSSYDLIVSFDMAEEVFTLLPKPPFYCDENEMFAVYENKLAILSGNYKANCDAPWEYALYYIELWVMEEDTGASGRKWSWTNKYNISLCPNLIPSATIWRNEIICDPEFKIGEDLSVIHLLNLTTNEFKKFSICNCFLSSSMFNYVESLVSVGNNHIEKP